MSGATGRPEPELWMEVSDRVQPSVGQLDDHTVRDPDLARKYSLERFH